MRRAGSPVLRDAADARLLPLGLTKQPLGAAVVGLFVSGSAVMPPGLAGDLSSSAGARTDSAQEGLTDGSTRRPPIRRRPVVTNTPGGSTGDHCERAKSPARSQQRARRSIAQRRSLRRRPRVNSSRARQGGGCASSMSWPPTVREAAAAGQASSARVVMTTIKSRGRRPSVGSISRSASSRTRRRPRRPSPPSGVSQTPLAVASRARCRSQGLSAGPGRSAPGSTPR